MKALPHTDFILNLSTMERNWYIHLDFEDLLDALRNFMRGLGEDYEETKHSLQY